MTNSNQNACGDDENVWSGGNTILPEQRLSLNKLLTEMRVVSKSMLKNVLKCRYVNESVLCGAIQ